MYLLLNKRTVQSMHSSTGTFIVSLFLNLGLRDPGHKLAGYQGRRRTLANFEVVRLCRSLCTASNGRRALLLIWVCRLCSAVVVMHTGRHMTVTH